MRARGPSRHCWTTWTLFFVCSTHPRQRQLPNDRGLQPTFHFSMSSCCFLYCFTNSSSTFFSPSELVCNAGVTSFTVLSTSTPLIMRKHLRSGGNGPKVSSTSLFRTRSAGDLNSIHRIGPCWRRVVVEGHIPSQTSARTCVLQHPVRCLLSSGQVAVDCSCKLCIVVAALADGQNRAPAQLRAYLPCCFFCVSWFCDML